jgi:RNA polymerase-binding transcription factor DksA
LGAQRRIGRRGQHEPLVELRRRARARRVIVARAPCRFAGAVVECDDAAVAIARGSTGEFMIINGRRVRAISTKGITVAKKSKTAAAEVAVAPNEQQIREIKTKLTKKELDEYRALLLVKRRQLFGMLSGMEDEALRSSGGNLSNMPVHMADMGSDVYDQDFTLGMAETERAILAEIDAALQRIEDKTFGVCQMTGKPISKARLDAKPWAKYTIEAERIAESSGSR